MDEYENFLLNKQHIENNNGFSPLWMPDFLYDFQKYLVEWALLKGRAALFEDCGLGKTPQQLVWAENVVRHTGKPVLILAPLAVSAQTKREAEKFGIEAHRSMDSSIKGKIIITNYEKLHFFNSNDFQGIVLDESSILKSFSGKRRKEITKFMKKIPYRLLATATAAPNDYIELGTSSEALGYMGCVDMINKFFINDLKNTNINRRYYGESPKFRFSGHAEIPFWRWVTSWARACRMPSDLGFDDNDFVLPKLIEKNHFVETDKLPKGLLLPKEAYDLREQRSEKRRTIKERCQKAAELIISNNNGDQSATWCQYNEEGDFLEKIIPDSVQIAGKHSDERKEAVFLDFQAGNIKNLITKPKIGGWGMNWQNCSFVNYFIWHSYEEYFQGTRRFWRFGQKNKVTINRILTRGEMKILRNLDRKHKQALNMFDNLIAEMNNSLTIKKQNDHTKEMEVPKWL